MVILVTLILSGRLARGYGLRGLVRHENRGKQFVVGAAFGILLAKTLFVGYLLETNRLLDQFSLRQLLDQSPWQDHRLWVYLAGIALSFLIPVLAAITGIGIINLLVQWSVRRRVVGGVEAADIPLVQTGDSKVVPIWPLLSGLGLAGAGFVLLLLLVQSVPAIESGLSRLGDFMFDALAQTPLLGRHLDKRDYRAESAQYPTSPDVMALHGLAACSTATALAFYAVLVPLFPRRFSPVVPGCFLLNIAVAAVGWFAFFLPGALPLLLLVAALAVVMGGLARYKIRFPHLDYEQLRPLTPCTPVASDASPSPDLLCTEDIPWETEGHKRPMVVVCASGGGIRAAAWTLAVLEQLEQELAAHGIAFPYYVRLVTGASGGMVGASYYVATLQAPDRKAPGQVQRQAGLALATMLEDVCRDSLTPLVYRLVYEDLWKIFMPLPFGKDRGVVLEETWKVNLHGALDCTLASLRCGEAEGWRPSLVLSPMMIEDGRRLLISNLDLASVTRSSGNVLLNTNGLYSCSALELFRIVPSAATSFRLSTAVRMSASFPYFSPAGVLPTLPRRRVVDAGYYDNYGISVAAAWLFAHRDWIRRKASGVLLVQIRDSLSESARTRPGRTGSSTVLSRGLEWITTPPDGLFSAREWVNSFRNDEQLGVLTDYSDRTAGDLNFTTVAFEYGGDASLNWYLTHEEQQSIRQAAHGISGSQSMKDLLAWWAQH
jgi:hypothetical protein